MEISPEQARAELARRQQKSTSITPEQAQAELERRKNPGIAGRMARGMKSWSEGLSFGDEALEGGNLRAGLPAKFAQGGTQMVTNLAADTLQDPLETWVINPAKAIKSLPGNIYHSGRQYAAKPMFNPAIMGGSQEEIAQADAQYKADMGNYERIKAERPNATKDMLVGGAEALGIIPLLKGPAKAGAKGISDMSAPAAKAVQATDPVASALERAIRAEGKKPQDLLGLLDDTAKGETPDMLFQSLGLDQTAQALGNRAGPSRGIMQEAAIAQQRGQRGRVDNYFREALDNPNFDASTESIERLYSEKGSPLYEAAFNATPQPSDAMKKAVSNPGIKSRLDSLGDRLAKDGVDLRKYESGREGRLMQLLKEDLDDEISVALRKGESKRAGRLGDMRNQLVQGMDESYPGYREARQTWSGGKRKEEAIALGREAMKADPRDFADKVNRLTNDELEFARAGVVRELENVLNVPESYSAIRAQLRKPNFQQNMETLIGKEKAAQLVQNLEDEARRGISARLANFANGSKTAPTGEAIQALEVTANSPVRRGIGGLADLVNRNGVNPANYVKGGADKVVKAINAPNEQIMADLATLLSKPASQGAKELLEKGFGQDAGKIQTLLARAKTEKQRALILGKIAKKSDPRGLPLYAGGVGVASSH